MWPCQPPGQATECIVSGVRPAIAQTIVHLGIDLGTVVPRSSRADALAYALRRQGIAVVPVRRL
ncbi:hypothetical protein [Streptomyces sp. NPDC052693]|uniref:hypothetical protein n=1 Tax=Streptomyces sp. NPDC052693 TaxID=3155814 RepID=UPI0034295CB0